MEEQVTSLGEKALETTVISFDNDSFNSKAATKSTVLIENILSHNDKHTNEISLNDNDDIMHNDNDNNGVIHSDNDDIMHNDNNDLLHNDNNDLLHNDNNNIFHNDNNDILHKDTVDIMHNNDNDHNNNDNCHSYNDGKNHDDINAVSRLSPFYVESSSSRDIISNKIIGNKYSNTIKYILKKDEESEKERSLQNAMLQVRELSISIAEAARRNNCNKNTLRDRCRGRLARSSARHGRRKFSDTEELSLKEYILNAAAANKGINKYEIMWLATQMYRKKTDDIEAEVGKNWFRGFMSRYPDIRDISQKVLNFEQHNAENLEIIRNWFGLVRRVVEKYNIHINDIYNFDESGFELGESEKAEVITHTQLRETPSIVSFEDQEWVTVAECIKSTGKPLPPYIIFKGKALEEAWFEDLTDGEDWRFDTSASGWTNDGVTVRWLSTIFVPHATTREGEYVLLIFDGDESHYTWDFCEICESNKIIILCMPSGSSHLLQPLDAGCFLVLKHDWQVLNRIRARNAKPFITKEEFVVLYDEARQRAFSKSIIEKSFSKAGLQPIGVEEVLRTMQHSLTLPLVSEKDLQPESGLVTGIETVRDKQISIDDTRAQLFKSSVLCMERAIKVLKTEFNRHQKQRFDVIEKFVLDFVTQWVKVTEKLQDTDKAEEESEQPTHRRVIDSECGVCLSGIPDVSKIRDQMNAEAQKKQKQSYKRRKMSKDNAKSVHVGVYDSVELPANQESLVLSVAYTSDSSGDELDLKSIANKAMFSKYIT